MKDKELLKEFIAEAEEQIEEMSKCLLELEKDKENKDAVEKMFRAAHTLKGNAGAMGFQDVSNIAHKLEDAFLEIKEGKSETSDKIFDFAFSSIDRISDMIQEIKQYGKIKKSERSKEDKFSVEVYTDKDSPMKSVDASLVLSKVEKIGKITMNNREEVEEGRYDTSFSFLFEGNKKELEKTLKSIG